MTLDAFSALLRERPDVVALTEGAWHPLLAGTSTTLRPGTFATCEGVRLVLAEVLPPEGERITVQWSATL